MENKTIWLIVMMVVVIAVIAIFVNVSNTTGRAAGDYGEEWFWDECDNDYDCENWERCIDGDCIGTETDLAISFFDCDAVEEEGTKSLKCTGVVRNIPPEYSQHDVTAETVVLFGGFFESDSTIVRTYIDRGKCLTDSEFAHQALMKILDEYGGFDIEEGPFNLKEPETTIYCNLGNIDFAEAYNYDYDSADVTGQKLRFEVSSVFEDMPPVVVMCVKARGTEEYFDYNNCEIWEPTYNVGACCYSEYDYINDVETPKCIDLEDRRDCRNLFDGTYFSEQTCTQIHCPSLLGACRCCGDYIGPANGVWYDITEGKCESNCENYESYAFNPGEDGVSCPEGPGSDYGQCCCYEGEGDSFECVDELAPMNGDKWGHEEQCYKTCVLDYGYYNYHVIDARCQEGGNCPPVVSTPTGSCCTDFDFGPLENGPECYYDMHASTCAAIDGTWSTTPCDELTPGSPCNPYGACCHSEELIASYGSTEYNMVCEQMTEWDCDHGGYAYVSGWFFDVPCGPEGSCPVLP